MLFGGIELPGHPDLANIRALDLLPIPQICRMMQVGVAIDVERLGEISEILATKMSELELEITSYIPPAYLNAFLEESGEDIAINVDSAEQIAELLFKVLKLGEGKDLKRTPSGLRISTGKKQLEKLKRDHPVIPKILEYREASKLKSTYADALPLLAKDENGAKVIHTQLLTTRTSTGRLASKKPNLQNIPTRTKLGQMIRRAFISRPGCRLISIDYSQIELRLLADRANERKMIEVFRTGGDIHVFTAMQVFDISDPALVDHLTQRNPCKAVNFGVVYGLTAAGLYDLIVVTYATAGLPVPDWVTIEWCEKFIEKWFGIYSDALEYFQLQHWRARRYEMVWDMFGRTRLVPEVRSQIERVQYAGLRQAGNLPIQAAAAGVMKIGMARVERVLEGIRASGIYAEALLPVHDELLIEVDAEWAEEVEELCRWEMEQALVDEESGELRCRVPIKTEGSIMTRWSKAA